MRLEVQSLKFLTMILSQKLWLDRQNPTASKGVLIAQALEKDTTCLCTFDSETCRSDTSLLPLHEHFYEHSSQKFSFCSLNIHRK